LRHGPRIYNLFPLLAGAMPAWADHLPRIAAMGFDWIFVNPFHEPGFSGSLYAIKDPWSVHPLLRGASDAPPAELVRGFVEAAGSHRLGVMMDLVVNHTAKDALLVEAHPDWYRRNPDGTLRSPGAVDPVDPRNVTVWGDLAELDYSDPRKRDAQVAYWSGLVAHYQGLGMRGFRCDAAYQVPVEVWRPLIDEARRRDPDCLFAAETLGCTPEQVLALADAGFDVLFNSAKWWDFRADWLLEQYEAFRAIAPSIAFPESHDTPRLAVELEGGDEASLLRHYRLRYLFAACFSAGVMIPMGFEYGFRKPLHVVDSRPGDWEHELRGAPFDLTGYIAEVNALKAALPALAVEGPQRRATSPHAGAVALVRLDRGDALAADHAAVTLLNPDPARPVGIDPGPVLVAAGGRLTRFTEVTPGREPAELQPGRPITLQPLEARVFRGGPAPAPRLAAPGALAKAARRRLEQLAASRVVIERVWPELDGGRFPVKRLVGDVLEVHADIFCDGHDKIDAELLWRRQDERRWRRTPMSFVDNDRWRGTFPLTDNARHLYTIEAWRDLFASWRVEVMKKLDAGLEVSLELTEGRLLLERSASEAEGADGRALAAALARAEELAGHQGELIGHMLSDELARLMRRAGIRTNPSRYERELELVVDRTAAGFAAWYELFPRSQSGDPARHGTFRDVVRRLPYVRGMGFDVLYFTPIHPIGRKNRKGRNNSLEPLPGDPGSPYAIGSLEGGHRALHPELGDWDDFAALVEAAHDHGLEIALDYAIQCAPDHPWIEHHPEWFDWRPDGSIKYAENPPKKYEDIVNVHFYRDALPAIWYELRDDILFWVGKGVKTFRVDNPHTKPVPFWEWMIREVQDRHPEVVFLSEAFTRPKMMKRLAKVGFTQSYSYFTWRNTKDELVEYLTELTQTECREYMRVNFFTNTPDINPHYLQTSGRPGFQVRLVLAATLSPVYGIYNGFELCEGRPVPGKEEYLDSEKYEIKAWDYDRPGNIRDYVTRVNLIRRNNPALWELGNLRFYNAWNDNIVYYGKTSPAGDNVVLVAVNLDPHQAHGAHFEVPLWELGLPDDAVVEAEELLGGARLVWHGKVQHMWLDPVANPCAIWRIVPPGLPG
jgi:starch synthase (maltosyl-transferring)